MSKEFENLKVKMKAARTSTVIGQSSTSLLEEGDETVCYTPEQLGSPKRKMVNFQPTGKGKIPRDGDPVSNVLPGSTQVEAVSLCLAGSSSSKGLAEAKTATPDNDSSAADATFKSPEKFSEPLILIPELPAVPETAFLQAQRRAGSIELKPKQFFVLEEGQEWPIVLVQTNETQAFNSGSHLANSNPNQFD